MNPTHPIGPFVGRFLVEEVATDRGLSPNTQKSYRDTIRLLFRFLAERHGTDPTCVTLEQVDATLLRDLKDHRGSSANTRNQHLTALRSLNRLTRPFDIGVLQSVSLSLWAGPTATGWSDNCRAGFAPARRKRLSPAH